jgi:asparagine synthase (glutamine-hydrolysing)
MCRIAGIVSNTEKPIHLHRYAKAMCDVMAHGGPDDEGLSKPELK